MMTEYKSVSIPKKLHKIAEENVEYHGYTSVPDLVKDLLRDWIKDIQNIEELQKRRRENEIMNALVSLAKEEKHEELSEAIIRLANENEESEKPTSE